MKARVRKEDCHWRRLPLQVCVLLNELRLLYVQAMGLTVSLSDVLLCVCVLALRGKSGFPIGSLQPPVRSRAAGFTQTTDPTPC